MKSLIFVGRSLSRARGIGSLGRVFDSVLQGGINCILGRFREGGPMIPFGSRTCSLRARQPGGVYTSHITVPALRHKAHLSRFRRTKGLLWDKKKKFNAYQTRKRGDRGVRNRSSAREKRKNERRYDHSAKTLTVYSKGLPDIWFPHRGNQTARILCNASWYTRCRHAVPAVTGETNETVTQDIFLSPEKLFIWLAPK